MDGRLAPQAEGLAISVLSGCARGHSSASARVESARLSTREGPRCVYPSEEGAVHDEAIRTFLLHDHGRVVRAVTAACGDRQRAEDAVQDALVDVWTKDRAVDDLPGWVAAAAINRARSRWRTQAAERRAFDRLAAESAERRAPSAEAASAVPFDARVAQTLRDLPRSQRSVVALHYLLDMSVADVAARLGMAEGTVKTHLHRARATLRAALGGQPEPRAPQGEVRHA